MEIDTIISIFDRQIRNEWKDANGVKERCPSYWSKILFIKTLNLTITDWRKIRVGDYWEIRDKLKGIERKRFTLKKVKEYLDTN